MWISTSQPSSDTIPIACFVGNNVRTVPLKGATIFPSVGLIRIPFPNTSHANASSADSLNGDIEPLAGAKTTSCVDFWPLLSDFSSILSSLNIK